MLSPAHNLKHKITDQAGFQNLNKMDVCCSVFQFFSYGQMGLKIRLSSVQKNWREGRYTSKNKLSLTGRKPIKILPFKLLVSKYNVTYLSFLFDGEFFFLNIDLKI